MLCVSGVGGIGSTAWMLGDTGTRRDMASATPEMGFILDALGPWSVL
jgi:hypothetical protein